MFDRVLEGLLASGPMAGVLFFMWWTTKKDLDTERVERQKDQRKWAKFLMSHMEVTTLEDDDDDDEEA